MADPALLEQTESDPFKHCVSMYEAGQVAEAAEGFKALLRQNVSHAGAWLNLGTVLRKMGRFEASLACTLRAVDLKPFDAGALTNLGNCLVELDRLDEALSAHRKAVSLKPDDFMIRFNYVVALREAGAFEQALAVIEALLAERPADVATTWEQALNYLYLGKFREGWDAFEIRWKLPNMKERISSSAKRWDGEDLSGKTLLIYEEQGFGDTILCSRYIPLIAERGGRVFLECRKPLHHLFAGVQGIEQIAEPGQIMKGFDYHIPIMSLPRIFGTGLSSVQPPTPIRIITAPPSHAARIFDLGKGRLRVGIVWSGSVTFPNHRKRSAPVERFLDFAEIPGVQLYSLQKGPGESDLRECGGDGVIFELGPYLEDFTVTASIVKQLDLIIMTDSAVAHLAGSLGVPVWNLLCYRPYWIYGTNREGCPWYPSMRLFRQPKPGDWDSVFHRVRMELLALTSKTEARAHG